MGGGSSTAGIVSALEQSNDDSVKEVAASKLCEKAKKYAASHPDYIEAVADAAGKPLILMLEKSTDKGKNHAAATLSYLCLNKKNKQKLAEAGVIPALAKLLKEGTPELKGAAAAALANLPSGNPKNQEAMTSAGVIPPLVEMVKTGLGEAKGWAASALGNMALTNKKNQQRVAEAGGIEAMLELASHIPPKKPEIPAIANTFKWKLFDILVCRKCRRKPIISDRPESRNNELAARALSGLAYESQANQARIVKGDGIDVMMKLAKHGNTKDSVEALRLVNIVWGKDATAGIVEKMINAGGVPILVEKVRTGDDDDLRGLAANAIGRLVHEDAATRDSVATHEGIPALVDLAQNGHNSRIHAMKALREITTNSAANRKLVEAAGGKPILERLKVQGQMQFRELTQEEEETLRKTNEDKAAAAAAKKAEDDAADDEDEDEKAKLVD